MQPSKSVSTDRTVAPLASGCTSCAMVILPRGSTTIAGMPAAAAYAASDADVSPVDAQPTARICRPLAIICRTIETSTVIPRSLNEPVCELPHSFTQTSSMPMLRPKASARNRLVPPSSIETTLLSLDLRTDPFLLAPDARSVRPDRSLVALVEQAHPRRRAPVAQRVQIVRDFEQAAAGRTAIDDRVERRTIPGIRQYNETQRGNSRGHPRGDGGQDRQHDRRCTVKVEGR